MVLTLNPFKGFFFSKETNNDSLEFFLVKCSYFYILHFMAFK